MAWRRMIFPKLEIRQDEFALPCDGRTESMPVIQLFKEAPTDGWAIPVRSVLKQYHFRDPNVPPVECARRVLFATNSHSVWRREFVAKRTLSKWRYYPGRESGTVSDRERHTNSGRRK